MPSQWQGEPCDQRHRNGEVVVVVIAQNRKEGLVEDQPFMAEGLPIFTVLEPLPVGLQKVVAVLISSPNQIHHVSGVKQKRSFLLVGQKSFRNATRWAMTPMTASATVAKHEEVKGIVRCGVGSRVVDDESGLIDPPAHQLRMVPAHALAHLADLALNGGVAGEIQNFSGMGATTCKA